MVSSSPAAQGPPAATGRARAASLPADERRAAIVAATLPLVLESGRSVTTRQIASASGVAEGTVFSVFRDKDELLDAVVDAAFDPEPTEAALARIDRRQPLEDRLADAVDILRRRAVVIFQIMSSLGMLGGSRADGDPQRRIPGVEAVAQLLDADRDALRVTPLEAAQLLRGLTLVSTHPALSPGEPLSSAEVVSLLLDGVRSPRLQDPR